MSKLDAREQLLKIWNRWGDLVQGADHEIRWGDSRNKRNCVVDAEFLLCLLQPHILLDDFNIVQSTRGVRQSLEKLGADPESSFITPKMSNRIVELLMDYYLTYSGVEKSSASSRSTPRHSRFYCGSYFSTSADDLTQQASSIKNVIGRLDESQFSELETVDAYSYSALLSVYTLILYKQLYEDVLTRRNKVIEPIWEDLRVLASERLSLSLAGLLSCFAMSTEDLLSTGDWQKQVGRSWPERIEGDTKSRSELEEIRNSLKVMGATGLSSGAFYEIGFAWGPVKPEAIFYSDDGTISSKLSLESSNKQSYHALSAPSFYFTVVAIDTISQLSNNSVASLEILNEEQLSMLSKLRNFENLTRKYWKTIALASDSSGSWAIEQLPWRPTDGPDYASEYWNLYLGRMIFDVMPQGKQTIERMYALLLELAKRGRVVQEAFPPKSDPILYRLHFSGFPLGLEDPDGKNLAFWFVLDYSPQLLKACGNLLKLTRDPSQREKISSLINDVWMHLDKRRDLDDSQLASWDDLSNAYPAFEFTKIGEPSESRGDQVGSWYLTQRVAEALSTVATAERVKPELSNNLDALTLDLLAEFDWLVLNDESLRDESELRQKFRDKADEARELVPSAPAIAFSVAVKLIQEYTDASRSVIS